MGAGMNVWGTTDDWAGSGPHKVVHMDGAVCCLNGELIRVQGRDGDMSMLDGRTGELLETWQCTECHNVWFRRPGMTGFFMVHPMPKDDFRC